MRIARPNRRRYDRGTRNESLNCPGIHGGVGLRFFLRGKVSVDRQTCILRRKMGIETVNLGASTGAFRDRAGLVASGER